ncbi:MAG TPA: response regulator [Rubrivivax sp.]|nr:response regulator [Rubrivivax sp.]
MAAVDEGEKVDILIVDDLPEKLLVFGTVLEELGQNLVFVRSGAEALREVLKREFAVILLDVNMPDIDGFETATLIRNYKKSAHTPIIFITAYADEFQTRRGYSLGAVDYITSPVVPEVLRSKVRVFVELQVLQRRIARQADARVAHAAAEAALQLAEESTRRSAFLSDLSHSLSGLLDVRGGLHKLLGMVVPQLAPEATVVLVDEHQQPQIAATWGQGQEAAHELRAEELSPEQLRSLQRALQGIVPQAQHAMQGWPLRHGQRVLGALLLPSAPTLLGVAVLDEVTTRAAVAFASAQLHQSLQEEIVERRRAELRLEEAGKRKDEFLAMLSHELRNPLAPIGNAVEIIRRIGGHDSKLKWAADITERQVRQLKRLVDELLDVARISQGKIVLQNAPLELGALLTQCVEIHRPTLAARRQTLTQALPAGPVWVVGDAARLQQVLNNLLSNASKYTPEGGSVNVAIALEGGQAVLSVRDNGVGIEASLLPRVFDLFEQGSRTLDRSQGGLGVGLTLVQRLVKLHEGRVEAHSAGPGQGAEFRVYLPFRPAPPAVPSSDVSVAALADLAKVPRRVLLVDDNVDIVESTADMLAMAGHTLRCAHDGAQALAMAQEFAPEVVLLDIGLPGLDGYQVARLLRQLPQLRHTRLIALTGYGMAADRQRSRDAGFDHHLTKPVDPSALRALIELNDGVTAPGGGAESRPQAGQEVPDGDAPGAESSARNSATVYTYRRP